MLLQVLMNTSKLHKRQVLLIIGVWGGKGPALIFEGEESMIAAITENPTSFKLCSSLGTFLLFSCYSSVLGELFGACVSGPTGGFPDIFDPFELKVQFFSTAIQNVPKVAQNATSSGVQPRRPRRSGVLSLVMDKAKGKGHANSDIHDYGEVNWYKWTESQARDEAQQAEIRQVKQFVRRMRGIRAAQGHAVRDNEQFIGYGEMHLKFMKSSIEYEENINKNFNSGHISKEEHEYELNEMSRHYHFMEDELEMRKKEYEDAYAKRRAERIREEQKEWDEKYAKYIVKLGEFSQGHDDAGMATTICHQNQGPHVLPSRDTRSSTYASTHGYGEGGHMHTSPHIQEDDDVDDEFDEKKMKEDESGRKKKKCVNQNILGGIKADKEKLRKAYNDRSLSEDERIRQIDEVYKKYDKMEINLIEREDSEIAWYVEGHQAWRDVGEDADEEDGKVVESAGTDEDQYVVNLAYF
ncbi:hypothetical protein AgCh_008415 [Apium graveolens]